MPTIYLCLLSRSLIISPLLNLQCYCWATNIHWMHFEREPSSPAWVITVVCTCSVSG